MAVIIDRRKNKESIIKSKQRYLNRNRAAVRQEIDKIIKGTKIKDITKKGQDIKLPKNPLREPKFAHTDSNNSHDLYGVDNKRFAKGDQISIPNKKGGGGSGEGDNGSGETSEDDFIFTLTKDEFSQLLFEYLALPNLVNKGLSNDKLVRKRAGYDKVGTPAKLDLKKTFELAIARRIACRPAKSPFLDNIDLRYKHYEMRPKPFMQAVVFCIMDVSGSMEEEQKLLAKKFYILLDLFLSRMYQRVELVFIRHHTEAKLCDEEEFFTSRETGGTVISTGLSLAYETIKQKYPSDNWNIYIAQTGDGENYPSDNPLCHRILVDQLLPICQYILYLQVADRRQYNYLKIFLDLKRKYSTIATNLVTNGRDLFKAFAEFFSKDNKK